VELRCLSSVLWQCWLGHLTRRKTVPDRPMTYNVFGGTLNLALCLSIYNYHCVLATRVWMHLDRMTIQLSPTLHCSPRYAWLAIMTWCTLATPTLLVAAVYFYLRALFRSSSSTENKHTALMSQACDRQTDLIRSIWNVLFAVCVIFSSHHSSVTIVAFQRHISRWKQ